MITNRLAYNDFKHILCTKVIINDCTISLETKERSYIFPLYLNSDLDQKNLFTSRLEGVEKKQPNINQMVLLTLSQAYKKCPAPVDIFHYIYAVLYSNTYRTKYAEFLKIDFPRVPFTKDSKLFQKLREYGKRLADLHLMQSDHS